MGDALVVVVVGVSTVRGWCTAREDKVVLGVVSEVLTELRDGGRATRWSLVWRRCLIRNLLDCDVD